MDETTTVGRFPLSAPFVSAGNLCVSPTMRWHILDTHTEYAAVKSRVLSFQRQDKITRFGCLSSA